MSNNNFNEHIAIPLYGNNPIPNYNADFAAMDILYSNDGNGKLTDNNPTITPYLVENSTSCVVIYPGGGFFARSDYSEGIQIAETYNKAGISAFVVRYRIGNPSSPHDGYDGETIVMDAQRAVQFVRYNADKFGIDSQKITVCGFSAGGFLALATTQKQISADAVADEIGKISNKPSAVILCYARTNLQSGTGLSSLLNILTAKYSDDEKEARLSFWNPNLNVSSELPPTFSWGSLSDTADPPKHHSNIYCAELRKAGVPCEEHIYENTPHGKGLSSAYDAADWLERSVKFLKKLGF